MHYAKACDCHYLSTAGDLQIAGDWKRGQILSVVDEDLKATPRCARCKTAWIKVAAAGPLVLKPKKKKKPKRNGPEPLTLTNLRKELKL